MEGRGLKIFRCILRSWALLTVLIVVFVVWGKSLPHWQTLSAEEKATLTFFALTNLGLLLAWFSSFWGAMLSFVSIIIFMVVSHGIYINLVPKGLYGDVSGDKNMREVSEEESKHFTFFMYEEIDAFRIASETVNLCKDAFDDVFYNNAVRLFDSVKN